MQLHQTYLSYCTFHNPNTISIVNKKKPLPFIDVMILKLHNGHVLILNPQQKEVKISN
jgi:hypothetical protein